MEFLAKFCCGEIIFLTNIATLRVAAGAGDGGVIVESYASGVYFDVFSFVRLHGRSAASCTCFDYYFLIMI